MRPSPRDPHAAFLLSAMNEVVLKSESASTENTSVLENVREFLGTTNLVPGDVTAYENADQQIAALFVSWSKALAAHDPSKAASIAQQIATLTQNNPFPYSETTQIYSQYGYPETATYAQALKNYRTGPTNPPFGVIGNKVADDAKVGILGDWGTGDPDSLYLLTTMLAREPKLAAILHLGDIYDAGTPYETARNFVNAIAAGFQAAGLKQIPIYSIPGNHEYFSGGAGFFEMIDTINGELDPSWQQEASYFCLRNQSETWQFLGADTGITCVENPGEPGLLKTEIAWHKDRLTGFHGKTIFMTHHQFAAADFAMNHKSGDLQYFNSNLIVDMATLLPNIDLHLWGHDHWFVPYVENLTVPSTPSQVLRRGQLMGGSARETTNRGIEFQSAVQTDSGGQYILPGKTNKIYNHTYAIVDLKASTVSYYEVPGWEPSDPNPDKTCPTNPLLVTKL